VRRQCPHCLGKKLIITHQTNGLDVGRDCGVCRMKGEVIALPVSVARKRVPNAFPGIDRDGYAETGMIDQPTNLMTIVLPDESFNAAKDEADTTKTSS
jgi:hypothetical protein